MKKLPILTLTISLLFCGACRTVDCDDGWKDLFDKNLSNAEYEKGVWSYDSEGCLTPNKDKPIFTKEIWENFELEFEFAMGEAGNSGLFFYVTKYPSEKIEVQMQNDFHESMWNLAPYQYTGSLYGHQAAFVRNSKPAGEWNTMRLVADGKHVMVWVNGEKTADADLDDFKSNLINPDGVWTPPYQRKFKAWADIPTRGKVGFQGTHHGEDGKLGVNARPVRIRNARIRNLAK